MDSIWVVDDDASIRFVLEKALAREALPVRSFARVADARAALTAGEAPAVIVSDIRMPGESGLDWLAALREAQPQVPVIIMTAYSDLDSAVGAFQAGAFDYLAKPFDVGAAVALIRRALAERGQGAPATEPAAALPELLGQAPAMQELFRAIGRLSHSQVTVLITGESGTGKELVARALHRHSPRARGPFVAINTAAIPKDLLESELFGHERGAFTGAQAARRGRFEQAEGGTLFLDEIGDMPLELQTRLLRVLSENQYYRVGGQNAVHTDVRIVAATHQNLEQLVLGGQFREDLFHRLHVIRLRLPPLRERPGDIALLADVFLARSARELAVPVRHLSAEARAVLTAYAFPGNVRQLENLCRWLTVMSPTQQVAAADLPDEVRQAPATASALAAAGEGWRAALAAEARARLDAGEAGVWDTLIGAAEAELLAAALAHTGGRRVEAAQALGIGRNTLTRKLKP
ncbi:MAG: nitrogen regulation protein NR(I) [Proteobacteria bacterium]|nr:nitrogen regulation protein NR(I) [Pseudomonadota bacterium]